MAAFFNLTLDTLAPQNCSVVINSGAARTNIADVTLAIATGDADTTGYTMKVYGDIVGASSADEAVWEAYSAEKAVELTAGDGVKTVYVVIRDDVWNEAAAVSDFIELDTTAAVVTISGPDVSKVSEVEQKNISTFTFVVDEAFQEYKVMVVATEGAAHDAGTLIPTTAGSVNTSGAAGNYEADTAIEVKIHATDFKTAKGGADGVGIVKVFVKDLTGNWSA